MRPAGPTNGLPGEVFLVARLLADQHDPRAGAAPRPGPPGWRSCKAGSARRHLGRAQAASESPSGASSSSASPCRARHRPHGSTLQVTSGSRETAATGPGALLLDAPSRVLTVETRLRAFRTGAAMPVSRPRLGRKYCDQQEHRRSSPLCFRARGASLRPTFSVNSTVTHELDQLAAAPASRACMMHFSWRLAKNRSISPPALPLQTDTTARRGRHRVAAQEAERRAGYPSAAAPRPGGWWIGFPDIVRCAVSYRPWLATTCAGAIDTSRYRSATAASHSPNGPDDRRDQLDAAQPQRQPDQGRAAPIGVIHFSTPAKTAALEPDRRIRQ